MPAYNNTDSLKPHLEQFLKSQGVKFEASGKFLCPFHDDKEPSMGIVPDSGGTAAHCFACGASADIFKFASHFYSLDIKSCFPEIVRRVAGELGQAVYDPPEKPKQEKPVTLSVEAARAVYTSAAIRDLGKFVFGDDLAPGAEMEIETVFPCKNEAGEVEFVEARFRPPCFANGKKRTIAVWWTGKRLKSKNNPHGLFGRELLSQYPDRPVLIVEGPKCQDAAKKLTGFVPVAWNGGANGQRRLDFSPLKGRRVYILPDDDEPGMKSARATAKLLKGIAAEAIIVEPLPEAREIKPEKADICEWLEVKTPEEIASYILNFTQPEEAPKSSDPYIAAGIFLSERGFFRVYDKKAVGFFSVREEQPYNYGEVRDKYADDKINGLNPAKAAKMIDNLDPAYPVYHLVKSFAYPPGYMGQNGKKNEYVINRWRGFAYPLKEPPASDAAIDGEVDFVKGHIRDVVCGGNVADYEYLCKWIAHIFQRPDEKPGTAVFAHSEAHGTGKSLIFEQLIPNMLGVGITSVFTNKEQIAEKFNTWLFESIYVVFSEQSFYEHTENIKSWITEEYHNRRGMGVDSEPDRSFARFIICTNRESAFRFEKTERRMFVLNVSEAKLRDWAYFYRLGAAVKSAAVLNRMARFFCSVDIAGFNPFDLPESQKKKELIEAEKHPVIEFFETVASGEDNKCRLAPCAGIDPDSANNYHKCKPLYEALKDTGTHGELFIERKKLYDHWRNTEGRNRKETINKFTRIIKKYYPESKLEVIEQRVREYGELQRVAVIIVKRGFFDVPGIL